MPICAGLVGPQSEHVVYFGGGSVDFSLDARWIFVGFFVVCVAKIRQNAIKMTPDTPKYHQHDAGYVTISPLVRPKWA